MSFVSGTFPPGQCCLQWGRLPRLLLCYLLSTKTNSSFYNLQLWAQTLFETTTAGTAADRNRIVAHRNDHTEVSFLQQRRLTFSDRPATTTSRGFLQRAQRLPSALCWLVSLCSAGGEEGPQAVAPALTFQTLFFGPLTFGSSAQLRSSSTSAFPHFSAAFPSAGKAERRCNAPSDRDGGQSHALYYDGNGADDLLSVVLRSDTF